MPGLKLQIKLQTRLMWDSEKYAQDAGSQRSKNTILMINQLFGQIAGSSIPLGQG